MHQKIHFLTTYIWFHWFKQNKIWNWFYRLHATSKNICLKSSSTYALGYTVIKIFMFGSSPDLTKWTILIYASYLIEPPTVVRSNLDALFESKAAGSIFIPSCVVQCENYSSTRHPPNKWRRAIFIAVLSFAACPKASTRSITAKVTWKARSSLSIQSHETKRNA